MSTVGLGLFVFDSNITTTNSNNKKTNTFNALEICKKNKNVGTDIKMKMKTVFQMFKP